MRGCDLEQLAAAFEEIVVGGVIGGLLSKAQILGLGHCFICHRDVQVGLWQQSTCLGLWCAQLAHTAGFRDKSQLL